jgi:hypothetical protein
VFAEASEMEFTISCPIDGPVEVGLEDIDTVVLREQEQADITFVCPRCGSQITVTAIVPAFLMAAIEALAEESDASTTDGLVVLSGEEYETPKGLSGNPRGACRPTSALRQPGRVESAETRSRDRLEATSSRSRRLRGACWHPCLDD